jgi:malonate decarboxylase beta subunit
LHCARSPGGASSPSPTEEAHGRFPASFDAPRPSPHLARWGIAAQDDDGIVVARARIDGAPVLVAAQDERFLGGSAGANHADTLRRLFELARAERPAAVVILAASGGVRLHEANAAEWALARALAALLDLRAALVPVLVAGVGDVFGGASVLVCAAQRIALMPGVRLGLSGPAVIETARGRGELDAGDAATVARVFGAEARAAAGHVELLADSADDVRRWIARGLAEPTPLAAWVQAMQARLAARLPTLSAPGLPQVCPGRRELERRPCRRFRRTSRPCTRTPCRSILPAGLRDFPTV